MEGQKIENLNKWHLSKYNIFSTEETEDKKLPCVNLFKGSYSELDIEDIRRLYHLEEIENIEKELQGFIKQGIIVNFDELTFLQAKALLLFNSSNSLNITIVTTLKCNFNCPYCFENHELNKIDIETQNKIFIFITNILKSTKIKRLSVTWYGGEPLLAIDVIENLSKKLIEYSVENNIFYKANIITNGYLLNQEKIKIFEKNKINNIQITLDGLKENHDKTRCLIDGSPTFDKIIENLYNIKFSGIINIRHNTHVNNLQDSEKLKKIIDDIKLKTKNNIIYYQAVIINNPAEKRNNQVEFLDQFSASKIEADKFAGSFSFGKSFFCGAQKFWNLVIGSDGSLYKCWEDVWDKKRAFGEINTWNPFNPLNTSSNLNSLLCYINSISIFNDEECKQCVWLPVCAGSCPSKRIYHNMKCINFKDNPNYFIQKVKEYTIKRMTSVK